MIECNKSCKSNCEIKETGEKKRGNFILLGCIYYVQCEKFKVHNFLFLFYEACFKVAAKSVIRSKTRGKRGKKLINFCEKRWFEHLILMEY